MIAHPILASEDDEESLARNIFTLQDEVDEYFSIVTKIFEEHDTSLKPRAMIYHHSISTKFHQLATIPASTFRNNITGDVDSEIGALIQRLGVLWNRDVDQLTYGALSWRRTAQKLVEELTERLAESRIHFPLQRRVTRALVTPNSPQNVAFVSIHAVVVLTSCVALIVLPAISPPKHVGVAIGVTLSCLLLFVAFGMSQITSICATALETFYAASIKTSFLRQHGGLVDKFQSVPNFEESSTTVDDRAAGVMRTARDGLAGRGKRPSQQLLMDPRIASGNHIFTLKYEEHLGYIDARFIDSQVVMVGIDTNFKVTYWNNAAENATGFLKAECIGQYLWDLADAPGGELRSSIESAVKQQDRGKQIVKIRLRSFATAPVSLLTIVAPVMENSIVSPNGRAMIGNLLICANAQDNLREARAYLNDYQSLQLQIVCQELVDEGALSPEGRSLVQAASSFLPTTFSDKLEAVARSMVQDWEWTNATQLLSQSVGKYLGKCSTTVDPSFPNTICVNTFVPGIIEQVITSAPKRCDLELRVRTFPPCRSSFLVVEVSVPPSSRPFNGDAVLAAIRVGMENASGVGKAIDGDTSIVLHFPCQITTLQDIEMIPNDGTGFAATCSVSVLTMVTNMVEEHNISMTLLRARYVSVTNARDVHDVANRLGITPCDVDVIIADKVMLPMAKHLIEEHGLGETVTLVPLLQGRPPTMIDAVGGSASDKQALSQEASGSNASAGEVHTSRIEAKHTGPDDHNAKEDQVANQILVEGHEYVLYTPIEYSALERLIRSVAESVAERKRLKQEKEERERILAARQDSPWTRGKLLGRGSFGEVYEAISDLTGGKMAVKMFFTRNNHESEAAALLNEVRIMCSLNHSNIVHYFYCEQRDKSINLFMELCDCSLGDIMYGLKKASVSCKLKINEILKQVISAVAYLHGMGIAHRDIKPQNILLKDDTVKLTDFGTARQNTQNEVMSDTQGTFRYMAPEVFKGEPHMLSCDVWSIGCIACDLCSVTPDFMGAGNLNALGEMTHVVLPETLTGLALDFVAQCLRVQQDLRPAASMLLLHPFLLSSPENDTMTERFYNGRQTTFLTGRNAFTMSSREGSVVSNPLNPTLSTRKD